MRRHDESPHRRLKRRTRGENILPKTIIRTRSTRAAMLACVTLSTLALLGGCATVAQEQKRSVLDRKCQERVVSMLNTVSPIVSESNIPEKFCGCLTSKVDVVKLEADVDGVKEIGLNPETLRFVTEYIPTIRTCAKETGLWKNL
jgi:hypothetical protein